MNTTIDQLPPGAHRGIPAPRYHGIKAASASQLRDMHGKTPAHLKNKPPFVPTWETILGELIHHAILEPCRPFPQLAVVPAKWIVPDDYPKPRSFRDPKPGEELDWDWKRKFCKQWRQAQEDAGLIVVTKSDLDEIHRAVERVHACPEARYILEGSDTEVSLVWEDSTGFPCKARLDLVPRGSLLADLKTCADASPEGFERNAWERGYHIQAAWYLIGWDAAGDGVRNEFRFIAYERGVGLVKVHRVSPTLLEVGTSQALVAFSRFKWCAMSGEWPGYAPGVCEMNVPKWARKEVGL